MFTAFKKIYLLYFIVFIEKSHFHFRAAFLFDHFAKSSVDILILTVSVTCTIVSQYFFHSASAFLFLCFLTINKENTYVVLLFTIARMNTLNGLRIAS